jgi:hypothetical protein
MYVILQAIEAPGRKQQFGGWQFRKKNVVQFALKKQMQVIILLTLRLSNI